MDRREYLASTTVALAGVVAGCSDLTGDSDGEPTDTDQETTAPDGGTSTDSNETTTEPAETRTEPEETTTEPDETTTEPPAGSLPAWAEWIPADTFPDENAEVIAVDAQKARAEYPGDAYAELGFSDIAAGYGVSEADIGYLIGVSRSGFNDVNAVTGNYSPESIVDHLGVADENVESDRGYMVIQGETAIGDSAIINGVDYGMLLDVQTGETPALGTTDDDWQDLLEAVSDGTLVALEEGDALEDEGQSPLGEGVQRSGIELDAAAGGGARITMHLMFDSESSAQTALDENRQSIIDGATNESGETLAEIKREGKRIVIVIETDTFDF